MTKTPREKAQHPIFRRAATPPPSASPTTPQTRAKKQGSTGAEGSVITSTKANQVSKDALAGAQGPEAGATKQLRGDALKAAIHATIQAQAAEADAQGKTYTYVASRVAKAVPCARKSLDNYADFIDTVLEDLRSNRRARDGGVMIEALRARIAALEKRNQELLDENQILAAEHIAIYDTLALQSVPAAALLPGRAPQAGTIVPFTKPKR